ncbi:hypothetical protein, partial [Burkholderia pseudomallei]
TSSSSGIVQLKQPRPFSKIEMARRNQAGQNGLAVGVLFLRKDIRGLSMLSLNKKQHSLSYE